VAIEHALYAFLGAGRTSRFVLGGAVTVENTTEDTCERTHGASCEFGLIGSPIGQRTVRILQALDTATTIKLAVRSTCVCAMIVRGTIVDTDSDGRVAMRLAIIRTTKRTIHCSARVSGSATVVTTTIGTTVTCSRRTIHIGHTILTDSTGSTSRLTDNLTTIGDTTIGIGNTRLAGTIDLAILTGALTVGVF